MKKYWIFDYTYRSILANCSCSAWFVLNSVTKGNYFNDNSFQIVHGEGDIRSNLTIMLGLDVAN